MPLPIAPVAAMALRYGVVALAGAVIARKGFKPRDGKDALREASFENCKDGVEFTRTDNENERQFEASHGHWRRIWLGDHGLEIDSRVLGRLRLRRVFKEDK